MAAGMWRATLSSGDFRCGAAPRFQGVGMMCRARCDSERKVDESHLPSGAGAGGLTEVRRGVGYGADREVALASLRMNVTTQQPQPGLDYARKVRSEGDLCPQPVQHRGRALELAQPIAGQVHGVD